MIEVLSGDHLNDAHHALVLVVYGVTVIDKAAGDYRIGEGDHRTTVCAQFEVRAQQLQRERDARVSDLKGARAMLERLMEFENNLTGNVLAQEPSLAERIKAANAN